MKKRLTLRAPLTLAILSLLAVSGFLRYYLYVNSNQLLREFKNQNYREIYSADTLKVSSRLSSLSSVINWVCIEGTVADKIFYKMKRGECSSGIFQQRQEMLIPQANNIKIVFTTRLPKEVEYLFFLFLVFQSFLIFVLIIATRRAEKEKHQNEIKISKLARQIITCHAFACNQ